MGGWQNQCPPKIFWTNLRPQIAEISASHWPNFAQNCALPAAWTADSRLGRGPPPPPFWSRGTRPLWRACWPPKRDFSRTGRSKSARTSCPCEGATIAVAPDTLPGIAGVPACFAGTGMPRGTALRGSDFSAVPWGPSGAILQPGVVSTPQTSSPALRGPPGAVLHSLAARLRPRLSRVAPARGTAIRCRPHTAEAAARPPLGAACGSCS